MKKRILCFCAALFFLAGILGNISQPNTVRHHERTLPSRNGVRLQTVLLSADSLNGIEDFHIVSDADGTGSNVIGGMRQSVPVCLIAVLLLFFGVISLVRRKNFSDKRIPVFLVVKFIHRSDGKKKACFDKVRVRTGGYQSENRNKIQNIIH